ncbi:hypothetical protein NMY22_g677 [Coprinellus aureogranulatus]|nr:hypothetical protein NMY22_g677 [Coprinellus aureogranulatus]
MDFATGEENPRVMLISLKAGALGLNLTVANNVFLMDPWWQEGIESQAIDRVNRIGQKKNVHVYQLIAENTVESKVLEIQDRKKKLIKEAFAGTKSRETQRQQKEARLQVYADNPSDGSVQPASSLRGYVNRPPSGPGGEMFRGWPTPHGPPPLACHPSQSGFCSPSVLLLTYSDADASNISHIATTTMAASQESLILYSPSKRVKLTLPIPEYDEEIAALRCAPTTLRYLKFFADKYTTEEARARRELRAKDPSILDLYVFALNDDGEYELAGSTGVFNLDGLQKSCEGGILVAPKFVGKGLTAEIFYTLFKYIFEERGFHRISFETSMENEPMRGWFEKAAGIRQEGVKKEWWSDGRGGWTDVGSYALLDREWEAEVKARLEKRIATRK